MIEEEENYYNEIDELDYKVKCMRSFKLKYYNIMSSKEIDIFKERDDSEGEENDEEDEDDKGQDNDQSASRIGSVSDTLVDLRK